MSRRSRPFMKYFLVLTAIYVIMGFGIQIQLWIERPCLMSGARVSTAGISGDRESVDVMIQNQEMVPGYLRAYIQGVSSYKAEEILRGVFLFMKTWVFAGLALNFLVGLIILLWAKNLHQRIYLDVLEIRRRRNEGHSRP